MADKTDKRQGTKQSSTVKSGRLYGYQMFNGMIYREDKEPMTEADWDSITAKFMSIVNSHGLVFVGKTTPQGLVEEEKKESKLILPPE